MLEQQYVEGSSIDDAKTIAARAVQSATERDTTSGNGLLLAAITTDGVDITQHESVESVL